MKSFDVLWDESPMFRGLFIGKNRPFIKLSEFDEDKAFALWEDRFPKIEWSMCGYNGCTNLVKEGQRCNEHAFVSGKMPTWSWVNKTLYRYSSFQRGAQKMISDREYREYIKHVASRKFGKVPSGYRIFLRDGNVFNYRPDNLVLLSKYSYYLVENRFLAFEDAVEIDMRIGNLLHDKMHAGRRPFMAVFGYGDIARVAGTSMPSVWKEVERGNLDPANLTSIVEFVNRRKNKDNEKVSGETQG